MNIMDLVLWALFLGGVFGGVFGYCILGPAMSAGRKAKGPAQFYLSDLFSLLLLAQLTCGGLSLVRGEGPIGIVVLIGGFLLFLVVFVWLRSVKLLSRIGVSSAIRRGVFVVVIVPVAILGSLVAGPVILAAVISVVHPSSHASDASVELVLRIIALSLIPVCVTSRFLTRWVLAGAKHEPEESPVDTPDDPPVE